MGHNHPQSFSFHLVSLTGASSMGLEKRIIICIYHYGIGVFYCPQNQYRILSIFLINPCSFISSLPLKISLYLHLGKWSPWCFHLSPWAPPLLSLQSHCNIFWGINHYTSPNLNIIKTWFCPKDFTSIYLKDITIVTTEFQTCFCSQNKMK